MDSVRILSVFGLAIIGLKIYLSVKRERNKPRHRAAERFLETFLDEIRDLNEGRREAAEILRPAFPKHEKAYNQFRHHLNGKSLRKLDDAWKGYSRRRLEDSQSRWEPYSPAGNGTTLDEKRRLALGEMLHFLSSAKKYSRLLPL
jgi:hypothetical protein